MIKIQHTLAPLPNMFWRPDFRDNDGQISGQWIGQGGPAAWPPRSLDFFLWRHMKTLVYQIPVDSQCAQCIPLYPVARILISANKIYTTPGVLEKSSLAFYSPVWTVQQLTWMPRWASPLSLSLNCIGLCNLWFLFVFFFFTWNVNLNNFFYDFLTLLVECDYRFHCKYCSSCWVLSLSIFFETPCKYTKSLLFINTVILTHSLKISLIINKSAFKNITFEFGSWVKHKLCHTFPN